jgi:hypothetical protein
MRTDAIFHYKRIGEEIVYVVKKKYYSKQSI